MKNIVIVYEHFAPAYKAGGIIKSLKGIISVLNSEYKFSILTSAYDLKENKILEGIKTNTWVESDLYKVKYFTKGLRSYFLFIQELLKLKKETFYLNGIYSFKYFILPLLIFQIIGKRKGIIIAPRGMVQKGALEIKKIKKKVYIYILKLLPVLKNVTWHATDPVENIDIFKVFGIKSYIVYEKIVLAKEISILNQSKLKLIKKTKNVANFTTVSLITEKKNHLFFLKLLFKSQPDWKINYNIYGPIKDQEYWNTCLDLIKILPKNIKVNYHGFINPNKLEEAFYENHFFVLPTLGENFGHAILESLNFGKPVILSNKTPWKDLKENNSGWVYNNEAAFYEILKTCMEMENPEYTIMSKSAVFYAANYYKDSNYLQAYNKLFN